MLMRAESRSADRGRRAGRAHPGGAEGGARAGDQSDMPARQSAVAAARDARVSLNASEPHRRPRCGNRAGARGERAERAGGRPPCRARGVRRGRGGRGRWVRHVTGGPPPFCPAEAVFRAQRARRRHSCRDGASAPRSLPPPAPRPSSLRPARSRRASAILRPSIARRGPAPRRNFPPFPRPLELPL